MQDIGILPDTFELIVTGFGDDDMLACLKCMAILELSWDEVPYWQLKYCTQQLRLHVVPCLSSLPSWGTCPQNPRIMPWTIWHDQDMTLFSEVFNLVFIFLFFSLAFILNLFLFQVFTIFYCHHLRMEGFITATTYICHFEGGCVLSEEPKE